jgi:hypothetical protein
MVGNEMINTTVHAPAVKQQYRLRTNTLVDIVNAQAVYVDFHSGIPLFTIIE